MAIKDPNVFNRINTLNTNLENANIAEIEKNISSRLFNVLDGANSISVDSELYTSINDVTNASDIIARISRITLDTELNVNGENIANTGDLLHGTAAQTQASIDRITQSENNLTTLESNIKNLNDRLSENITKLTDIADEQHIITTPARGISIIDSDLTLQDGIKGRIDTILRILSKIITELNKGGGGDPAVLSGFRNDFMIADKTGIPPTMQTLPTLDAAHLSNVTSRESQYVTLLNNINNRISELNHEKKLRSHIDSLNKIPIHIQNGFLPTAFTDASTVASEGANEAATRASIAGFNQRITRLNTLQTEIPNIRARYAEHKNRLNRILQLQRLQERLNTHPETTLRQEEFQAISDISYHNLLLGPTVAGRTRPTGTYQPNLPNTITTLGCTPTVIPLNFIHGAALARPGHFDYTLCDSEGNPLRRNGGNFEYQLGAQTISLEGITFQNNVVANQIMTIDNLQINPVEGLTFPLSLDLNVRVRIHDDATGLDIDHHKPIHLEITRPVLDVATEREPAYDSLVPPMNDRIQAEYSDNYRENLENEAIWNILREGGNEAEVNEIYNNETRRNMLIDRIRRRLAGNIPLFTLADLQTGFRADMTSADRDVPVQYLLNRNAFQNYVRQSIPDNLRTYALGRINNNANTHRDDILQELVDFQADIANNRVDKADNLNVLANIPAERPEGHPKTFFQRLTGRESVQNNYTKFFQGRQAELKDLSLETEDGTINYGVKIEVAGVNKLTATINIDGHDEPEIIDAPNHDELITGILNMANTKDGEPINKKLLCNIALSALKAMVLMSPQRLNRQIPTTNFVDSRGNAVSCDRVEAFIRGGNLRLRGGGVDGSCTRHNVTIFDEAQFKELHDENMLENGIRELSTQINIIMNATAQEYDDATSAMRRNDINRYVMQYNTVQWLRGGPVKRLRGRMIHGKTSNDFDFDNIAINEAGKSVNISLNRGLFTVSGDFDGQPYKYRSRNLGSILRKKIGRDYIFNGVEFAMIAAINETFIQKLRKNHWVATENFIISDMNNGKTGRTYIFDSSGNLSYLEIENANLNPLGPGQTGRIDPNQIPTARRRCNDEERKEFMQNPLLAGRLQREMRRRLSLF